MSPSRALRPAVSVTDGPTTVSTYLLGRAGVAGVPLTALLEVADECRCGATWTNVFEALAERFEAAARQAQTTLGACGQWRAAAASFQAATYGAHLAPGTFVDAGRILALRERARRAYSEALPLDPYAARLSIACGKTEMDAVLRWPPASSPEETEALVLLLNGLDSITEAEMHGFGAPFLERGFAVLALDAPFARRRSGGFTPLLSLHHHANEILAVASQRCPAAHRFGLFGVSLGGLLAAHLLSASPSFSAAVVFSPPAFLPRDFLKEPRLRLMLSVALQCPEKSVDARFVELEALALSTLAPPQGALRIFATRDDRVFSPEHVDAFVLWAKGLELSWFEAEHVGTTKFHFLLPQAADWLAARLGPTLRHGAQPSAATIARPPAAGPCKRGA
ncbi:alpha/beta hydrolase [Sinorhizobium meliloti]|uniref:alpha/beta hydrolase n=1 Tax=Rhizobium meliloti TaxID=382 RepID=UPI000FD8EBF7|nr:alpha/beta hydrolase [Sinorhizobium meliloti]MDW9583232.1 alpha/beta hydrolase [Sinorhizobium meliloti]MDX0185367.1 alpha/beta hydrolase [Sinorhizobium meliloti]MDX2329302.1 alpha/beta hydrolase [Sinorhizobium medicae]RVL29953.1 alpha/beta hydrolase [Sinorhizobium meliloti]